MLHSSFLTLRTCSKYQYYYRHANYNARLLVSITFIIFTFITFITFIITYLQYVLKSILSLLTLKEINT